MNHKTSALILLSSPQVRGSHRGGGRNGDRDRGDGVRLEDAVITSGLTDVVDCTSPLTCIQRFDTASASVILAVTIAAARRYDFQISNLSRRARHAARSSQGRVGHKDRKCEMYILHNNAEAESCRWTLFVRRVLSMLAVNLSALNTVEACGICS